MTWHLPLTLLLLLAWGPSSCQEAPRLAPDALASCADRVAEAQERRDLELETCRAAIAAVQAQPSPGGAPAFAERRVAILGRARGVPVVWVREPRPTPEEALAPALRATRRALADLSPGARLRKTLSRHRRDYPALRSLLLREGYLYSADPQEALILVKRLQLDDLFGEPEIWLQRGAEVFRLKRTRGRVVEYRHVDGPQQGRGAVLLLSDRVAAKRADLADPLHRDLRPLAWDTGFDRARISHRTPAAMVAELRFGGRWHNTLLRSQGAALEIQCVDAPRAEREQLAAWQAADAPRRRALAALRSAVDRSLAERLPFDRPRGAEDHLTDGQLRPGWWSAYRRGRFGFTHDEEGYAVFDDQGRPRPPQMCVDFVLDSFERGAGTWFSPRGKTPERVVGALDFTGLGMTNRAGVLAFGKFAAAHPELFEHREIPERDRIPFGERKRFFAYLLEHADDFRPGDVVSIQGLKRDGNIHQHAILLEDTDPVTGFPYGLADQMKWPRRRTWEGIMAEAPKRALLYHVRLKDDLLTKLDPKSRTE
jgi:hypothetical protein